MIESPRVAVCVPSGEDIKAEFATAMFKLIVQNKVPLTHIFNKVSSRISFNRNGLVEQALATDATHVLFIDADMVFPVDGLIRLLNHDLDIVGATASRRSDDDEAIGCTYDGSRLSVPSSPVKMLWMGLPFMLIKREVFEKMEAPWFAEPPWKLMAEVHGVEITPQITRKVLGHDAYLDGIVPEDQYFCMMAQKVGFDVWCDIELSMEMKHYGSKAYQIMKPEPFELKEAA